MKHAYFFGGSTRFVSCAFALFFFAVLTYAMDPPPVAGSYIVSINPDNALLTAMACICNQGFKFYEFNQQIIDTGRDKTVYYEVVFATP